MKKKFLFINCEEAKHICDKAQYGEATGWELTKLKIRLMWCHITRGYSKRNNKLTESLQRTKIDCLKATELKKLKNTFDKELSKQQQ